MKNQNYNISGLGMQSLRCIRLVRMRMLPGRCMYKAKGMEIGEHGAKRAC
jgi:hypothetical protein